MPRGAGAFPSTLQLSCSAPQSYFDVVYFSLGLPLAFDYISFCRLNISKGVIGKTPVGWTSSSPWHTNGGHISPEHSVSPKYNSQSKGIHFNVVEICTGKDLMMVPKIFLMAITACRLHLILIGCSGGETGVLVEFDILFQFQY